jgi:hypothetical protein
VTRAYVPRQALVLKLYPDVLLYYAALALLAAAGLAASINPRAHALARRQLRCARLCPLLPRPSISLVRPPRPAPPAARARVDQRGRWRRQGGLAVLLLLGGTLAAQFYYWFAVHAFQGCRPQCFTFRTADACGYAGGHGDRRVRSHCRFLLPFIHFIPYFLRERFGASIYKTTMRPNPRWPLRLDGGHGGRARILRWHRR